MHLGYKIHEIHISDVMHSEYGREIRNWRARQEGGVGARFVNVF